MRQQENAVTAVNRQPTQSCMVSKKDSKTKCDTSTKLLSILARYTLYSDNVGQLEETAFTAVFMPKLCLVCQRSEPIRSLT